MSTSSSTLSSKKAVEGFERLGSVGPDESCSPEKYQIYVHNSRVAHMYLFIPSPSADSKFV